MIGKGSIMDSLVRREIMEHLSRGRLLTPEQARFVSATPMLDADRSAIIRLATENAMTRIGTRINAQNIEALDVVAPEVAAAIRESNKLKARRIGNPMTGAERKALHLARKNDIGPIPPVADQERRDACHNDLRLFGTTYCSSLLKHEPSDHMMVLVRAMETALIQGGKIHVRWPRGKGKTTWAKIACLWAIAYGHRRYMVAIASTAEKAKRILESIYRLIVNSEEFGEDFPEIAHPIRACHGIPQRLAAQHIAGKPTNITIPGARFVFPTVDGSPSSGSVLQAFGTGGSVRGESEDALRPDMVIVDDAQKRGDAKSVTRTDAFEDFLVQDVYGLAGHDRAISVLMASTPVHPGDGSSRFADPDRHPEMTTVEIPLVVNWPDRMDLWETFSELYRQDLIAHRDDASAPWASRDFYLANKAIMDAGADTIDPEDGERPFEVSAIQHAMILRANMGQTAFDAEYQMVIRRAAQLVELTPDMVAGRINNSPRYTLPPPTAECVAFVDVNIRGDVGLRYAILAIGRGNVAAVIDYGRWPSDGRRIYPPEATESDADAAIARALAALTDHLARLPLTRAGKPRSLHALCIDGGWRTAVVAAFCASASAPFKIIRSKGFGWRSYFPKSKIARPGNHCHLAEADNGLFLAVHADYWKEYAQRAWLAPPLQAGSLSLFGSNPAQHATLAEEVCAERLIDTGVTDAGKRIWTWQTVSAENHYGDVIAGALAAAAWYRLLEPPEHITARSVTAKTNAAPPPDAAPGAATSKAPSSVINTGSAARKTPPQRYRFGFAGRR